MLQIVLGSAAPQPRRETTVDKATQFIVDLGVDFLRASILGSGKFRYELSQHTGKCTKRYNLLRHAGAIIELCRARVGGYGSDDAPEPIVRALKHLASHLVPASVTEAACQTHWRKGETKLGLTALTILAFCAARNAGLVDESLGKSVVGLLANHLAQIESRFEVLPCKYAVDLSWTSGFRSSYYPSQAGLSLIAAFELTGNQRYLESAVRIMAQQCGESDLPTGQHFDHHWEVFCLLALKAHDRHHEFQTRLDQLVELALYVSPDEVIHSLALTKTSRMATRAEAAGVLALNAAAEGQTELSERLAALTARLVSICQMRQILPSQESSDVGSVGGFVQTPGSEMVRIDYVQHSVAAALTLLHVRATPEFARAGTSVNTASCAVL